MGHLMAVDERNGARCPLEINVKSVFLGDGLKPVEGVDLVLGQPGD
jgi:hypothetical protein